MEEVNKLRIPHSWAKLIRRLMGLTMGRYQIILSIEEHSVNWTVITLGAVEQ